LSKTHVVVLSEDDYNKWDHAFGNLEERFMRYNFDFEILSLNEIRGRELMEGEWKDFTFKPSTDVALEEVDEDDLAPIPFFKNSKTWKSFITPAESKRKTKPVQRLYTRPDESGDEKSDDGDEDLSDSSFSNSDDD
jgi:hypothetical protein